MEFVEGITLKQYLKQQNKLIPIEQVFKLLLPVFNTLEELHKVDVLHRDISPDNIFITDDHIVKLLDFGAARQIDSEKSLSIVLKPGYAPEEQYRRKGIQGPWTDIYALAATIYVMLSGQQLPDALDRMIDDSETKKPSELDVTIGLNIEAALMKALAVRAKDRYQTVGEFRDALFFQAVTDGSLRKTSGKRQIQHWTTRCRRHTKILIASAAVLMLCAAYIVINMGMAKGDQQFSLFRGGHLLSVKKDMRDSVLDEQPDPAENPETRAAVTSEETTASTTTQSATFTTSTTADTISESTTTTKTIADTTSESTTTTTTIADTISESTTTTPTTAGTASKPTTTPTTANTTTESTTTTPTTANTTTESTTTTPTTANTTAESTSTTTSTIMTTVVTQPIVVNLPLLPHDVQYVTPFINTGGVITGIRYKQSENGDLIIYFSGQKTADSRGDTSIDPLRFTYSIGDADRNTLHEVIVTVPNLKTGESFKDIRSAIHLVPSEEYHIGLYSQLLG